MVYLQRGDAYRKKGQDGRAISDYNKGIELKPRDVLFYNSRAISYYNKGEYGKAWEDVYRAEDNFHVDPDFLDKLRKTSGRQK